MNRTLNQLINQLHLDPKKEAAVRKLVENAGSNKEVSGGSEPVIIEIEDFDSTTQLNDKQIEAAKNQNIKINLNDTESNMSAYLIPYTYTVTDNHIIFVCTMISEAVQPIAYIINISDKTMSKLS